MTDLPLWKLGADTFEAHQHMRTALFAIDWLAERNDLENLRQIQEYLNEKMPRKDAA